MSSSGGHIKERTFKLILFNKKKYSKSNQVDTSRREAVSQSELREEDDFLDEVLKTDVMSETLRFHHLMIKYA